MFSKRITINSFAEIKKGSWTRLRRYNNKEVLFSERLKIKRFIIDNYETLKILIHYIAIIKQQFYCLTFREFSKPVKFFTRFINNRDYFFCRSPRIFLL